MQQSTASKFQFDLNAWFEDFSNQFKGLNPNEPGQWPLAPRVLAFIAVGLVVVVLGWFLVLSDEQAKWDAEIAREPVLRNDFSAKLTQAVNLPELRKQKSQVEEYVTQLEKQLPGKAEMDALLRDINDSGSGRSLVFELFRPGSEVVKDYYAEKPITLKVTGRYHDLGAFVADVSNLSRIVTLSNVAITSNPSKDGVGPLSMEATARTYRYLDPDEVEAHRKETSKPGAKRS